MGSRWDRLLDLRTTTLVDALMTQAAKVMAEQLLEHWPPSIEGVDLDTSKEFAPIFAEGAPRPPQHAYRESIRLARWDLERDFDAFDDYMRNRRYLEKELREEHRVVLLFLSRWIVEQVLSLGDATDGRVRRKDMVLALERLEKLLLPA